LVFAIVCTLRHFDQTGGAVLLLCYRNDHGICIFAACPGIAGALLDLVE